MSSFKEEFVQRPRMIEDLAIMINGTAIELISLKSSHNRAELLGGLILFGIGLAKGLVDADEGKL